MHSYPYIGRFAPSPSGPLHNGSLVAAMASFLDARAHQGKWLLRIEDIDTPRVVKGADRVIMQQLQTLGMHWDGEVIWQSQRLARYEECFQALVARGLVYGCSCTRKEIADSAIALGFHENGQYPYPRTCRHGTNKPPRAWRLIMPDKEVAFEDRWLGTQIQNPQYAIGDIIIKRADGLFAYQLVVVVDDMDQGVTDIVRGQDLLDSTQRQLCLYDYLYQCNLFHNNQQQESTTVFPSNFSSEYAYPRYMHVPLILDEQGRKLSKQNHAPTISTDNALASLENAWMALGFERFSSQDIETFWQQAIARWAKRFVM